MGYLNTIGYTNFYDFGGALRLLARLNLDVQIGARSFWRYSINDGFGIGYGTAVANTKTRTRYIGTMPTLSARWQLSQHLTVRTVLNRVFVSKGYKAAGERDLDNVTLELFYFF